MSQNPPIDFAVIDPQKRYRDFNRRFFGSRLPSDLPIIFKPLKSRSGETRSTIKAIGGHTVSSLRSHARFMPLPASMAEIRVNAIVLSNLMRYDEGDFDAILLHEMCHASVALSGWAFEQHGHNFMEEARRVSKESGVKIPLTHDTRGSEVSKAKKTGVVISEGKDRTVYYLFDPKALEEFKEKAESDSVQFDKTRVLIVTSGVWAHAVVKKKPERYGTRYWRLTPDVTRDISGAEMVAEYIGALVRKVLVEEERVRRMSANPPDTTLLKRIRALLPKIAAAAQEVYESWQQDDEGLDEERGAGGICDVIAEEIGSVLASAGINTVDGGEDGDDHAYLIAYDNERAYAVDIPPSVYERGSGYSWKKIKGVTITKDDVVVDEMSREDLHDAVEENPPTQRTCKVAAGKFHQPCGATAKVWVFDDQGRPWKAVCRTHAKRFANHKTEDMESVAENPRDEAVLDELRFEVKSHEDGLNVSAIEKATGERIGELGATRVWVEGPKKPYAVDMLWVESQWQRKGVATELYRLAIERGRTLGRPIVSYPGGRTEQSEALHEKMQKSEGVKHARRHIETGSADVYENPPKGVIKQQLADLVAKNTTFAQVHDAVAERLVEIGAQPDWLASFVAGHCEQADREHRESERQHCHVGHIKWRVCYASAADDLPLAHKLGLVLHEFGHLVLQGKNLERPWKFNEQDASDAGGRLVGLQVPFKGRMTLEWARPPRWLLDKLGGASE